MANYRPVAERICDYRPVELPLAPETLTAELRRCQDCGIPFCHGSGCPLGNPIPEMNAKALAGHWRTALACLLSTSPFPEFTSRVCPALCEGSCVQGLVDQAVPCRLVEYEIIERGFAAGLVKPQIPARRLGLKAAVIGSGPAGLAAAWKLNQAGAEVSVYECDHKPGGFLRYGIPDFKLSKDVLDRRIDILKKEGIAFECGVEAGVDISVRLLERRHDLLVLAIGARNKRDLNIPGRNLAGIYPAIDFLSAQNRVLSGELAQLPPDYVCRGKRVVVIGGGDTGSDCVGTAIRLGAREVSQFEIMPRPPESRAYNNPWPQWPRVFRASSSHEEGCARAWSIDTTEFLPSEDDPGRLGGMNCRQLRWVEKGGRLIRPEPGPGGQFRQPADLVLLAMGFTGVENGQLLQTLEIAPGKKGLLMRDGTFRLHNRVYACGDAVKGPSLVVRAIFDGLAAAEAALAASFAPN